MEKLLEELLEKKAWLDQMIAGLEAAADSPQHRLIAQASETFEQAGSRQPKVDIGTSKRTELEKLAQRVGGRRGRPAGDRIRKSAVRSAEA